MWNPNNAASIARQNELLSDLWIERNVVGGLDSMFLFQFQKNNSIFLFFK